MQREKVRLASIAIPLVLTVALLGGCTVNTQITQRSQTTVTDLVGRQVQVTVPVERVVLASARDLHNFAPVEGVNPLERIVGWGPDLKLNDQDTYLKYKEKFPQIDNIPEIGYHLKGTFSVEKVISLEPDVVIFPLWCAESEGVTEDIARLEEAGIPSVVIDYWKDPLGNSTQSTLLLGTLLGKEKRAQEIVDFCEGQVNEVISRLQKTSKPKPKVYVEVGNTGPSEYGSTYGNTGWGVMVEKAGGTNIADEVIERMAQINPEYLIAKNPDVIIVTGSYWPETAGTMRLGYYATIEESRQLLRTYTERQGWNTLNAVENGRVYSIYHPWVSRIPNFVAVPAFAKWFYPDEFKDLQPDEIFKSFHEKFLPVDYTGVWTMSIKE